MSSIELQSYPKTTGQLTSGEEASKAPGSGSSEIGDIEVDGRRISVGRHDDRAPALTSEEALCNQDIPTEEKPGAPLDFQPRSSGERTSHRKRATGLPVLKPRIEPKEISLPAAGKRSDRAWWKRGFLTGQFTGLGGVAVIGCCTNPVGWIVGSCAIGIAVIGALAYFGKVGLDHRAASRRAQQVQDAMQSLHKQDVRLSREQLDRLERLSSKDWEELVDVSDLKTGGEHRRKAKNRERPSESPDNLASSERNFDYRRFIRERAILDVATNQNVDGTTLFFTEATRRKDAKKLIADVKQFKAGLIADAAKGTLSRDLPFPEGVLFALDDEAPEDSPRARDRRVQMQNTFKGSTPGRVPPGAGRNPARTESPQYQKANEALYKLFSQRAVDGELKADQLTGVKDDSEVESVNSSLRNAICGELRYHAMSQGPSTGENDLPSSKDVEVKTVSALAARDSKRFADLFKTEPRESESEAQNSLRSAMHGILYAKAAQGATFEELEDAKDVLTEMTAEASAIAAESILLRQMNTTLAAAGTTSVGKAMAFHLNFGLEKGQRGWTRLNYQAAQRAKNLQSSADAARAGSKRHAEHRDALIRAGLSSDSAAYVTHWADGGLGVVYPLKFHSNVDKRMKQLLCLKDYAEISKRNAHPYIPGDDHGLPDVRKDKIRAILYVVGADKPSRAAGAKGDDPLQTLARRLCRSTERELDNLLDVLGSEDQVPQGRYEAVQAALEGGRRDEDGSRAQSVTRWLPAWSSWSQADHFAALAYGDDGDF